MIIFSCWVGSPALRAPIFTQIWTFLSTSKWHGCGKEKRILYKRIRFPIPDPTCHLSWSSKRPTLCILKPWCSSPVPPNQMLMMSRSCCCCGWWWWCRWREHAVMRTCFWIVGRYLFSTSVSYLENLDKTSLFWLHAFFQKEVTWLWKWILQGGDEDADEEDDEKKVDDEDGEVDKEGGGWGWCRMFSCSRHLSSNWERERVQGQQVTSKSSKWWRSFLSCFW